MRYAKLSFYCLSYFFVFKILANSSMFFLQSRVVLTSVLLYTVKCLLLADFAVWDKSVWLRFQWLGFLAASKQWPCMKSSHVVWCYKWLKVSGICSVKCRTISHLSCRWLIRSFLVTRRCPMWSQCVLLMPVRRWNKFRSIQRSVFEHQRALEIR